MAVKGKKKNGTKAQRRQMLKRNPQEAGRKKVVVTDPNGKRVKVTRITLKRPKATKGKGTGRPPVLGKDGKPRVCFIKDCGGRYRSSGYCSAHYQFARAHAWPMPLTRQDWRPPAAQVKARAEGRYVKRAA